MGSLLAHSTVDDFSLVRGGPLFRLLKRLGLERTDRPLRDPLGLATLVLLVAWLPLFLLCWSGGGGPSVERFLSDLRVQSQLLLALPVLLACEAYVDGRVAEALQRVQLLELLSPRDTQRLEETLAAVARQRDSGAAELLLLVAAVMLSLARSYLGLPHSFAHRGMTPAVAWYVWISLPLFAFVLLRWGWRFHLWCRVLWRLSRLDLRLVPSHADLTGGLQFLAISQASFAIVVFAMGCVVGAGPREPLPSDASPLRLVLPQIVFAVLAWLALNLPLASFTRKLLLAKRSGDLRFSALMAQHSHGFERKWLTPHPGLTPLGNEDMQSQADIISSHDVARKMRWMPFDTRSLISLLLAALVLPLVPQLIQQRELLDAILKVGSRVL